MEILNDENFDEKIKHGVVLVDFFANWCGPCRMLAPILEEVQAELGDSVKVFKVDVDNSTELAKKFRVMSIPALFVFSEGNLCESLIGLRDKDELIETLQKYI